MQLIMIFVHKYLPLKSHEGTKVDRKLPVFRIVTTETDDVEGKEVFVYKDHGELHKRVQKSVIRLQRNGTLFMKIMQ